MHPCVLLLCVARVCVHPGALLLHLRKCVCVHVRSSCALRKCACIYVCSCCASTCLLLLCLQCVVGAAVPDSRAWGCANILCCRCA